MEYNNLEVKVLSKEVVKLGEELSNYKKELAELEGKIAKLETALRKDIKEMNTEVVGRLRDSEDVRKTSEDEMRNRLEKLKDYQHEMKLEYSTIGNKLESIVKNTEGLTSKFEEEGKFKNRSLVGFIVSTILLVIGAVISMLMGGI